MPILPPPPARRALLMPLLAACLPLLSPPAGLAQATDPVPTPTVAEPTPLPTATPAPSVARPSPTAKASPTPSAPVAPPAMVELSFDFSQGVILLDIDYGGSRPAKVVFDTGDADSLLDLDAARAIGMSLEMKDLRSAGSGEGAVTFYKIDPSRARLGAAEFSPKGLIVMPVAKNLAADSGIRCEGTLGYEFFKDRVVQIDYPARKLRLFTAAPGGNPKTAAESADVPIQWRQYHSRSPQLITTDQLHIGDHSIPAQIDTCFAHSLIVFLPKTPWLEIHPSTVVDPVYYEEATLQPVTLPAPISLGNLHFATNPVAYIARADAHVPETDITAVLGNRFFQNGVLTIDFRTGRLSAEWTAAAKP